MVSSAARILPDTAPRRRLTPQPARVRLPSKTPCPAARRPAVLSDAKLRAHYDEATEYDIKTLAVEVCSPVPGSGWAPRLAHSPAAVPLRPPGSGRHRTAPADAGLLRARCAKSASV